MDLTQKNKIEVNSFDVSNEVSCRFVFGLFVYLSKNKRKVVIWKISFDKWLFGRFWHVKKIFGL